MYQSILYLIHLQSIAVVPWSQNHEGNAHHHNKTRSEQHNNQPHLIWSLRRDAQNKRNDTGKTDYLASARHVFFNGPLLYPVAILYRLRGKNRKVYCNL